MMKAGLATAAAMAWLAVGLVAQTGGATADSGERITVIGCMERADQVSPAGSSAGTTVDSMSFVLIKAHAANAAKAASSVATPTATTGRAAAKPGATGRASTAQATGSMYRLDADVAKLNPHVGHQVEIVGMRDRLSMGAAQATNTANPTAASAPRLKVESVKMLAETCAR